MVPVGGTGGGLGAGRELTATFEGGEVGRGYLLTGISAGAPALQHMLPGIVLRPIRIAPVLFPSVPQPLCHTGYLIIKTPATKKRMNRHAPIVISQFIRVCCNPPANG